MNDEMIEGISPLVISKIKRYRFKRYTMHPLANRLIRKQYPILSRIPIVNWFFLYTNDDDSWDHIQTPHFKIFGSGGQRLKTVWCHSNDDMISRADAAEQKLNNFLKNLQGDIK